MRVIDASVTNCAKSETALGWNVQGAQGPQGPQGATGPQGPVGPQGPSGLSYGYLASTSSVAVAQFPAYSQVALLSGVPDGTYMVSAQIGVGNSGAETGVRCHVAVNGSELSGTDTRFSTTNNVGTATTVSAGTTDGGGSSVSVECQSGDSTTTADVNLALVRVDALN